MQILFNQLSSGMLMCFIACAIIVLEYCLYKIALSVQFVDTKFTEFAQCYTQIVKFWTYATFSAALVNRFPDDREKVLSEFYNCFQLSLVNECLNCTFYNVINLRIAKLP